VCFYFIFTCTVLLLFVSITQAICCEDRVRNDLDCAGWGINPRFNSSN